MNVVAIIIGVLAGIGMLWLTFRLMFPSNDEFAESVKYSFTPNLISLFKGEYGKDVMAELRLVGWIFFGGVIGFMAALIVDGLFF